MRQIPSAASFLNLLLPMESCLKALEATEEGQPVRHGIAIIAARDRVEVQRQSARWSR